MISLPFSCAFCSLHDAILYSIICWPVEIHRFCNDVVTSLLKVCQGFSPREESYIVIIEKSILNNNNNNNDDDDDDDNNVRLLEVSGS